MGRLRQLQEQQGQAREISSFPAVLGHEVGLGGFPKFRAEMDLQAMFCGRLQLTFNT